MRLYFYCINPGTLYLRCLQRSRHHAGLVWHHIRKSLGLVSILCTLVLPHCRLAGPLNPESTFVLQVCLQSSGAAYWYQYGLFNNRPIPEQEQLGPFLAWIGVTGMDFGKTVWSLPIQSGLAPVQKDSGFRIHAREGQYLYIILGREIKEPVWSHPEAEMAMLLKLDRESRQPASPEMYITSGRLTYELLLNPDFYQSLRIQLRPRNAQEDLAVKAIHESFWSWLQRDVSGKAALQLEPGGCSMDTRVESDYDSQK